MPQGSVATYCRWDGNLCSTYIGNFLTNQLVKEFWKSVLICQSYFKHQVASFFGIQCRTRLYQISKNSNFKITPLWPQSLPSSPSPPPPQQPPPGKQLLLLLLLIFDLRLFSPFRTVWVGTRKAVLATDNANSTVCLKTGSLRIIWHNFTNSQMLLIIFGRERPYSILNWCGKKFFNWFRPAAWLP